jgi:ribosomal protein L20
MADLSLRKNSDKRELITSKKAFNQAKGIFGLKSRSKNIKNNQDLAKSNIIAKRDKKNPKRALTRIANDEYKISKGYKGSANIVGTK